MPGRHTVEMYAFAITVFRLVSGNDLDLWPLTLETFTAMPTNVMNTGAKFHWNAATKYGDKCITQNRREQTDNVRTAERHTRKRIASTTYSLMAEPKKT